MKLNWRIVISNVMSIKFLILFTKIKKQNLHSCYWSLFKRVFQITATVGVNYIIGDHFCDGTLNRNVENKNL